VPRGSAHYHPPSPLLAIWIPLLESVAANHAHFPSVLTSHIITRLLADADADPPEERDDATTTMTITIATEKASYGHCLSAWGAWLIEWCRADESDTDVSICRQDIFFQLVQALASSSQRSGTSSSPSSQQSGARALLKVLCASDRRLAEVSSTILGVTTHVHHEDAPVWREADLDVMESRVKAARSLSASTPASNIWPLAEAPLSEERGSFNENKKLPDGWRLLSERGGWRTCPIGIYVGGE